MLTFADTATNCCVERGSREFYIGALDDNIPILSSEDVFSLIERRIVIYPSVRVYLDGRLLTWDNYTRDDTFSGVTTHNVVDARAVRKFWDDGATIAFQGLELFLPSVNQFIRTLEAVCGCEATCTLFLTPPDRSGLAPHFDAQDVFVMQIGGSKRWKIWDEKDAFLKAKGESLPPTERLAIGSATSLTEPKHSIKLRRGEIIFIPRGFVHSTAAEDEGSVHLSLVIKRNSGLLALRSYALEQRLQLMEDQRMRSLLESKDGKVLPPTRFTSDFSRTEAVDKLLPSNASEFAGFVARRGRLGALQSFSGALLRSLAAAEVNEESIVCASQPTRLNIEGGLLNIATDQLQTNMSIDRKYFSAVKSLTSGERLAVKNAVGILAVDAKVQIARKLLAVGLIEIVSH